MSHINLVKLCVGAETVQDLLAWQSSDRARGPDGMPRHVTRMFPRRELDLLSGGSIYWVIKGAIVARQLVLRLDEVWGQDQKRRCALVLDSRIHLTQPTPRRAFQGWRYLSPEDAPGDLATTAHQDPPLPFSLSAALDEIGVI